MYDEKKKLYYQNNREKIIEKVKQYNKDHIEKQRENLKRFRDKNPGYYKKYYKYQKVEKKEKPVKTPKSKYIIKTNKVVSGRSEPKSYTNIYLDQTDLTKQTILSQARGKVSSELWSFWKLIIDNYSLKFINMDYKLLQDSKQDCYIVLNRNLYNYNYEKFNNAFPYWTEIVKRSFYDSFNKWNRLKGDISLDAMKY